MKDSIMKKSEYGSTAIEKNKAIYNPCAKDVAAKYGNPANWIWSKKLFELSVQCEMKALAVISMYFFVF